MRWRTSSVWFDTADTERCAEELQHEAEQLHELNAAQLHSAEADEIVSRMTALLEQLRQEALTWHLKDRKISSAFKHLRSKGKADRVRYQGRNEGKSAWHCSRRTSTSKVAKDFIKTVTEKATDAEILESLSPTQQVIKIVNEELVSPWRPDHRLTIRRTRPIIVMMAGPGAGKPPTAQSWLLCFASSSSADRCS